MPPKRTFPKEVIDLSTERSGSDEGNDELGELSVPAGGSQAPGPARRSDTRESQHQSASATRKGKQRATSAELEAEAFLARQVQDYQQPTEEQEELGQQEDIEAAEADAAIRPAKRLRASRQEPAGSVVPSASGQEGQDLSDTAERASVANYALKVGPALQHAASTALDWASLQVLQDSALLLASLVRLECREGGNVALDSSWRTAALQRADGVERRYTGTNDIAAIREPYGELREAWRRMHENPTVSPFANPQVGTTAPSSRSRAAGPSTISRSSRSGPSTSSGALPDTSAAVPRTRGTARATGAPSSMAATSSGAASSSTRTRPASTRSQRSKR